MKYEIRELELGGVLDQAITLTKNHFGLLFGIIAVTILPIGLANAGAQVTLMPQVTFPPTVEQLVAVQKAQQEHRGLFLLLSVVGLLIQPVANAALVNAIADTYLGKRATIGSSVGKAFSSILPLIWTWILVGLAVMGGLILLVIPGIIALFWFALATQVVVVEKISGFAAMKRSRAIMKGNIGTFFVLGIVIGAIAIGVGIGAAFIPQRHAQAFLGVIVQCALVVFNSAAVVVFYFSARCKNEQFDLQLLAQNVQAETDVDDAIIETAQ